MKFLNELPKGTRGYLAALLAALALLALASCGEQQVHVDDNGPPAVTDAIAKPVTDSATDAETGEPIIGVGEKPGEEGVGEADDNTSNAGVNDTMRVDTTVPTYTEISPTKAQMLSDLYFLSLDIMMNHRYYTSEYYDVMMGGKKYVRLTNSNLLIVGGFESVPFGMIVGIEDVPYEDLFNLDFKYVVRSDGIGIYRASDATFSIMYTKCNDTAVLINDQALGRARLITKAGIQQELESVEPGSTKFYKGAEGGVIFSYLDGDGNMHVFSVTKDEITEILPEAHIIEIAYNRVANVNAAAKDATGWHVIEREYLFMCLTIETQAGTEVCDLNGRILSAAPTEN